jgi:chromosome segregation ATPase
MATSSESIGEILDELKTLNNALSTENSQHYRDFTQFKHEYFDRNEDLRGSMRDIKGDMRAQSQDIDSLQTDVSELRDEFKTMKFELTPLLELKKHIQEQVIRYSSIGFLCVLGASLGISNMGI